MIITAGNLSESRNALDLARTNGKQNILLLNFYFYAMTDLATIFKI